MVVQVLLSITYSLTTLLLLSRVGQAQKTVDTVDEIPTYDRIYNIHGVAKSAVALGWKLIRNLTKEDRRNVSLIQTKIWTKLLMGIQKINAPLKELDLDIRFRRKPSTFLDSLLNLTTLDQIQALSRTPTAEPFGNVKLRWIEISSFSTQMQRFYNKRMKDILNGGRNIREMANSLSNYNTFAWNFKAGTNGTHVKTKYDIIPKLAFDKMFLEDGSDAFAGLKKLMDTKPEVMNKPQFDANSCSPGQRYLFIEPNGIDIPYYLLFFLCLVDIKFYVLQSYQLFHNELFAKGNFSAEANLASTMELRVRKKVELFDSSFGQALQGTGPTYNTQAGIVMCDPPPRSPTSPQRNFTYGESYEKLTNFIKVFVSPEQELHKSGTCRPTCDLMDSTYKACPKNETDCMLERERECLKNEGRCDKFDPVCPTGSYQCQNSSMKISVCPSKRFDRLYEYINGEDVDEGFHFGPANQTTCNDELQVWNGGWNMEDDVLVSTPHFCEICVCYCFEPLVRLLGNVSTRFFSLKSMRSDFKENRILVGIKFHRVQDQIHIATAEAVALPGRKVDVSTVTWNIPKYEKDPKYVQRLSMDMRSINLDDVATKDPDRVVTGVRFYTETYVGAVQYNYIGLEILTHKIDSKGFIIQGTGLYRRNSNSTIHRTVYQYPEDPGPDDPVNGSGASMAMPDSSSNQYVAFRGTSLVKDAAQSTIPYFDSQQLISPRPSWLRGVGVIHKSKRGFGGFLGFKLIEHAYN